MIEEPKTRNVAFVPLRGGSKSIPLKNIKIFAGKPLAYWTIEAAVECTGIECVYVATDSDTIKEVVSAFGFDKVKIISRSEQSASDMASTEDVMLEFAKDYDFDNIVLVQATSPLLTAGDLTKGLNTLDTADSVLSVVRQKRFLWKQDKYAVPLNYDYNYRPRRQEFDGFLVENGAFYITARDALLRTGCRLSGNIKIIEMPEESYFEIDDPSDWKIAEQLMKARLLTQAQPHRGIKMFLTDCDGTLTDGGMYYSADGDVMKKFNTRDGMGLQLLREHGIITGIITGENSDIVKKRGEKLGVDEILLDVSDKVGAVMDLCRKYQCEMPEVAYIGDDLNDIALLNAAGIAICPSNAIPQVKAIVNYETLSAGGCGAVREAAEYVIGGNYDRR